MTGYTPPMVSGHWLAVLILLFALLVAYAGLVLQMLLVPFFLLFAFGAVYVTWRFLVALEAIADGVQRIADQHDGE